MGFNNSARRPDVTADDSPSSERTGFLHPFARRLARGALVALSRAGDRVLSRGARALALAEGIVTAADALVDGLDRLDGCAQPEATATVDLGGVVLGEVLEARLARLESAVGRLEARHPARVVERRRAASPCWVCGGDVINVFAYSLRERPAGGMIAGLCADCGVQRGAPDGSEVLP